MNQRVFALSGLIVLFTLCSVSGATAASKNTRKFQIQFQTNRVHGLFNFAETISGKKNRSKTLREAYWRSEFARDQEIKDAVSEMRKLNDTLATSYSFQKRSEANQSGQSLDSLFLVRSAFSKDLNDFSERTLGLLPLSEHTRLFSVLAKLEPVYDEVVWNPNQDKLKAYLEKLEAVSKKAKADWMFKKMVTFYRANWPNGQKFLVTLFPIPGEKGHSTAQSLGPVESVGVLVDNPDVASSFGVMMHEIAHSLFHSQSSEFQEEFRQMFLRHPSNHRKLTLQSMNEVLATAIGNGWAYSRATGKLDKSDWYNDKTINKLARGMYSMVRSYVQWEHKIDQAFVGNAIRVYERRFPKAIYNYDHVLSQVFLATDQKNIKAKPTGKSLEKSFDVQRMSRSAPIDHPMTSKDARKSDRTLVLVVSEGEQKQLTRFTSRVPWLRKEIKRINELVAKKTETADKTDKPEEMKSRAVAGVNEETGQAFVVIEAKKGLDLDLAFRKLKEKKYINPKDPVITLE